MTDTSQPEIVAYKGFNLDLSCRGHKFEIGKTYEMPGPIEACARGFHACEHPLNVFDYYPPAGSRFAEVRLSGEISRTGGDTKVAAARISITAELGIAEMVARTIKWVFDRSTPGGSAATGYQGAASATGDRGAALASGREGAASGKAGNALFLVYRDDEWNILHAWAGVVGRDGIEPDVWYRLDAGGVPQPVGMP